MKNYRIFTVVNLVYTLLVILWGAYVRASGSGAGCGAHWPLCNGEIIPQSVNTQMAVEFLHRTSSGVSLVLVVLGYLWVRKIAERNSLLRRAAFFSVIAIFLEAALGASLVLLKLVEFDQSVARAISISFHLMNTLFLLGALTTVSWLSFQEGAEKSLSELRMKMRFLFPRDRTFLCTLLVFVLLGIAGAVTALGDTLFPAASLSSGLQQDLASGAHFLLKLRMIHPILALAWVLLAFIWSKKLEVPSLLQSRALFLLAVVTQFLLGFLNWVLMAPDALQILHLLMADLVFISFWLSGLKQGLPIEVMPVEVRREKT